MRVTTALIVVLAACETKAPANVDAPQLPIDAPADEPPPPPDCKAQRAVQLVAGNGGLAWFTQLWPLPDVIENFQAAYAFDDPANAADVTVSPDHHLYARRIASGSLWSVDAGAKPQPTAMFAGTNETHTRVPRSVMIDTNTSVLAVAATHQQKSLASQVGVVAFDSAANYGIAPVGAPAAMVAMSITQAAALFPGHEADLTPTAAQLANYVDAGAPTSVRTTAERLAFTANAFRSGLLSSVIVPVFEDDPHGAFANNTVTARADLITKMLDAFYRDLASVMEPCVNGSPVNLADNVALIVVGDTYKDAHQGPAGWPDGTVGGTNLTYIRSNGFLIPGWFGNVTDTTFTNFDPQTGALGGGAGDRASTARAAILYTIARGNMAVVTAYSNAPFAGLIAP